MVDGTSGLAIISTNVSDLTDAAGNRATLTLPSSGAVGSLGASKAIKIGFFIETSISGLNNNESSNDTTFLLKFTANLPTKDFKQEDIVVTGGTISNFQMINEDMVFTAKFTPFKDGYYTAHVKDSTCLDVYGGYNTSLTQNGSIVKFEWNRALNPPIIKIEVPTLSGDTSNLLSHTVNFVSDVDISEFTIEDITRLGGTLSNFTGANKSYSAKFTSSGEGSMAINIASNKFKKQAQK